MTVLETVGAVVATVLGLGAIARGAWRANRRLVRITDAVTELSPNGGHSIKDRVEENAATAARTEAKLDQLGARFDQHLRDHDQHRRRWRPARRR
jgi:hypothetical protein